MVVVEGVHNMTAKESGALKDLQSAITNMTEKLFGNGTRNGCIDQRLENVESYMDDMKEILPRMVTKTDCKKNHETKWTKIILMLGLAATWIGLFLRVMEVL